MRNPTDPKAPTIITAAAASSSTSPWNELLTLATVATNALTNKSFDKGLHSHQLLFIHLLIDMSTYWKCVRTYGPIKDATQRNLKKHVLYQRIQLDIVEQEKIYSMQGNQKRIIEILEKGLDHVPSKDSLLYHPEARKKQSQGMSFVYIGKEVHVDFDHELSIKDEAHLMLPLTSTYIQDLSQWGPEYFRIFHPKLTHIDSKA
ncbi:hypothetical protein BDA99DRAFT_534810 [Phascolomyces articulosus]|uniref:Uncharacterized protein n=1 Tax=Phascolomyces articulosus TaxID=60185 RepID=A0AAD5K698_9FUNG|nr:hypothetical protein BDA99DRAFT_534810 [Phascolomyces articulosus]